MKKIGLLFTGLLMGLTTVTVSQATTVTRADDNLTSRYHKAQPIMFVERGIEFIVFPNGDFDFYTASSIGYKNDYYSDDLYYKAGFNTRNRSINTERRTSTVQYSNFNTKNIRVVKDRFGNVRRVGHVYISYDKYGRVNEIGSINIKYNRNQLVQVGGLNLYYNKHGKLTKTRGQINRNWSPNYTYNNRDNYYWYDDMYYYYKKDGKTIKKAKTLNRRV